MRSGTLGAVPPLPDLATERPARAAAMLDRWSAEPVEGEPEWDVNSIEPMVIGQADSPMPRP